MIASRWAEMLEGEFADLDDDSFPVLDLADVTFVDHFGADLLRRLCERVEFRNVPPFVEAVLDGPCTSEEES